MNNYGKTCKYLFLLSFYFLFRWTNLLLRIWCERDYLNWVCFLLHIYLFSNLIYKFLSLLELKPGTSDNLLHFLILLFFSTYYFFSMNHIGWFLISRSCHMQLITWIFWECRWHGLLDHGFFPFLWICFHGKVVSLHPVSYTNQMLFGAYNDFMYLWFMVISLILAFLWLHSINLDSSLWVLLAFSWL